MEYLKKVTIVLTIDAAQTSMESIRVVFQDGTNETVKRVSLSGTETLDEVAGRIESAFGHSIIGWDVSRTGHDVIFTASVPEDNKPDVRVAVY
ncbi:hypothetical protein ABIE27_001172 [Paenibacillus sp. 4624]|uniref:hypothetical protein n=1 Tax=Paenibacillus sp. 4624 TaxID=3156453 RepID=UPI003D23E1E0